MNCNPNFAIGSESPTEYNLDENGWNYFTEILQILYKYIVTVMQIYCNPIKVKLHNHQQNIILMRVSEIIALEYCKYFVSIL